MKYIEMTVLYMKYIEMTVLYMKYIEMTVLYMMYIEMTVLYMKYIEMTVLYMMYRTCMNPTEILVLLRFLEAASCRCCPTDWRRDRDYIHY